MKKLMLLPAALLALTSALPLEGRLVSLRAADASFGEEEAANFVDFFEGSIRFDAEVGIDYLMGMPVRLLTGSAAHVEFLAEVGPDRNYQRLFLQGQELARAYYVRGEDGFAYSRSLGADNVAYDSPIMVETNVQDAYDESYESFFHFFSGLEPSALGTYFTAKATEGGFELTPTGSGLARLSRGLDNFLLDLDMMNFDAKSHGSEYRNLSILTDGSGTPVSMSFDHVESDRFGGIKEEYEVSLASLSSVSEYPVEVGTMSDEDELALQTALSDFAARLAGGNFTSTIDISLDGYGSILSYRNYYDFSGLGLMLTELLLTDQSYGDTFTGILLNQGNGRYYTVAVSPDSDYWQVLAPDEGYGSIEEVVPLVDSLSPDFFSKSGTNSYSFAPAGKIYADFYFNLDLLAAALGVGDYYSYRLVSSLYYASQETGQMIFNSFSVNVGNDGTLSFLINHETYLGYPATTTVTFSDFGTTDLRKVSDGEGNPLFADALAILGDYLLGGE